MGYSEIYCHICGVTFTIGRYRTLKEVKTPDADLPKSDAEFLAQYVLNARTSCMGKCDNEEEGDCLVHIPPAKETWGNTRDHSGFMSRNHDNDADSNDVAGTEADDDDDFIDSSSEVSEPYEYRSPDEDSPEGGDSDADMPDADAPGQTSASPIDSRLWQREMNPILTTGTIRPFVSWRVRKREREAQGFGDELPDLRGDDDYLEHIRGQKCTGEAGYSGSRISFAEMRGCTVAQALVSRPLDPEDWKSESDDESFEGDETVGFFLTGLTEDPASRDMDDPNFYPERHDITRVPANNYGENMDWQNDCKARDAMPFHPTCLEVFKRASLWRTGHVDIKGLVEWFKVEGSWDKSNNEFPRSAAVRRGYDQWWKHVKGDEHIVANPCYVPMWDKAIATGAVAAKSGGGALQGVFELEEGAASANVANDRFTCLDEEIRLRILTHLVPIPEDIANLRLASRAFRQLPRLLFWDLILQRRPWLWEAWCDLPYSRWTVKGEKALKRMDEAWRDREDIINHSIEVLEEDADDESENSAAIEALMAKLEEIKTERHEARADVPVPLLPSDTTDWHTIYKWLARPKPKWPKGLRNRRRIWVDCGYILERIEVNRREGKIPAVKKDVETKDGGVEV